MKKIKKYLSIIILFLVWCIFTIFLFTSEHIDLAKDFYGGFTTLTVGLFAIWLYIKQKEDFKRDIAAALLMEIRFAEKGISEMRNALPKFDPWISLLPTSSWDEYGHIFTDLFDQDELDLINEFYANCRILEKAAQQLDAGAQLESKAGHIQGALADIAMSSESKEKYNEGKKKLIELYQQEEHLYHPKAAEDRVIAVLSQVNSIATTTAGEKLKMVSGQLKGY